MVIRHYSKKEKKKDLTNRIAKVIAEKVVPVRCPVKRASNNRKDGHVSLSKTHEGSVILLSNTAFP